LPHTGRKKRVKSCLQGLTNFRYLIEKRKKQDGGQPLLLPVWIDNLNSDHEYSRENYIDQLQKEFYDKINDGSKYLEGVMIYGLDNEASLSLHAKHEYLTSVFQSLQQPFVTAENKGESAKELAIVKKVIKDNKLKVFM